MTNKTVTQRILENPVKAMQKMNNDVLGALQEQLRCLPEYPFTFKSKLDVGDCTLIGISMRTLIKPILCTVYRPVKDNGVQIRITDLTPLQHAQLLEHLRKECNDYYGVTFGDTVKGIVAKF